MNKKKKPLIRFKGFTDDWEQRKLKDIAPLQRGFDLPTTEMCPGNYPVVMSNGIGGYHSTYKVNGPGVVTGRSGTIGKLQYIEDNYWPHNTTLWVTNFYGNNPKYIYYLYQNLDFSRFTSGSGVPTLNRNDVHDFWGNLPSIGEQLKIEKFMTNLDEFITLHQRKCEKLKIIKKSMLENCFPKNGQKVPKIRFSGFTGDWEQRKLHEVADIIGGGTPSTNNSDYWDGDIDWYTPAEIGDKIFVSGSIRKITEEGLKNSSAKILPANKTVLFTSRAGIGNMAILQYAGATNQGFQSLICNADIDPYFIFSMKNMIQHEAERVAAGSTFAEISGKSLGKLSFLMPKWGEQRKLGNFFQQMDNLITLHQSKLEKLKKIKKSMLERMFV